MTKEQKSALEWLARAYPDSPKKRLKEWFANGRVSLDGDIITKPHLLLADPGERLGIGKVEAAGRVLAKRMPLRLHAQVNLLYIDRSLAIVNKGAGILSVPGGPEETQNSALKVLEKYLANQAPPGTKPSAAPARPLPVHRLDQYTSGLLCFAMNPSARDHLVKQVRSHSFIREYLALGDGRLDPPRGRWKSWFKLDAEGLEQAVFEEPAPGATEAVSDYEVLDTISWGSAANTHYVSRLRLRLKSGLKHQLRIHAARAGVPLLGDRHYHPDFKKAAELGSPPPYGCKRQALHASSIGFIHPETGKTKRFNSKFPRDLAEFEAELRAK